MEQQLKKLVIFFSLGGGTAFIAKSIAEAVGADLLELKPKKSLPKGFLKFVLAGFQVIFKIKPALLPFEKNPVEYDLIFLGTPVWAGNYNPAYRTFFSKVTLKDKKIALFGCCADTTEKAFENLKQELMDNKILGDITFREPVREESNAQKAAEWAKKIVEDATK